MPEPNTSRLINESNFQNILLISRTPKQIVKDESTTIEGLEIINSECSVPTNKLPLIDVPLNVREWTIEKLDDESSLSFSNKNLHFKETFLFNRFIYTSAESEVQSILSNFSFKEDNCILLLDRTLSNGIYSDFCSSVLDFYFYYIKFHIRQPIIIQIGIVEIQNEAQYDLFGDKWLIGEGSIIPITMITTNSNYKLILGNIKKRTDLSTVIFQIKSTFENDVRCLSLIFLNATGRGQEENCIGFVNTSLDVIIDLLGRSKPLNCASSLTIKNIMSQSQKKYLITVCDIFNAAISKTMKLLFYTCSNYRYYLPVNEHDTSEKKIAILKKRFKNIELNVRAQTIQKLRELHSRSYVELKNIYDSTIQEYKNLHLNYNNNEEIMEVKAVIDEKDKTISRLIHNWSLLKMELDSAKITNSNSETLSASCVQTHGFAYICEEKNIQLEELYKFLRHTSILQKNSQVKEQPLSEIEQDLNQARETNTLLANEVIQLHSENEELQRQLDHSRMEKDSAIEEMINSHNKVNQHNTELIARLEKVISEKIQQSTLQKKELFALTQQINMLLRNQESMATTSGTVCRADSMKAATPAINAPETSTTKIKMQSSLEQTQTFTAQELQQTSKDNITLRPRKKRTYTQIRFPKKT